MVALSNVMVRTILKAFVVAIQIINKVLILGTLYVKSLAQISTHLVIREYSLQLERMSHGVNQLPQKYYFDTIL